MLKRLDPLIGIFLAILIWGAIVYVWHPFFMASPLEACVKLLELLSNKGIYTDIFYTLSGAVSGLLTGSVLGIMSGIILAYFSRYYDITSAVIEFARSIPPVALFPLFMIVFGIGILSKIALIAFTITWIMLVNSFYGVIYSSKIRKQIAQLSGANNWQLFQDVVFLEALPHIFSGLRIAVSFSLILMITSEMIFGSNYGLGLRVFESSQTYRISELYATIFITGCIGFLFNKIVLFIERRKLHWIN